MDLTLAVKNLDYVLLSKLLSEEKEISSKISSYSLFHDLIKAFIENPKFQQDGVKLVYTLSNYDIDINLQDQHGNTALHQYLYNSDFLHPDVVEAFLRCNADIFLKNKNGESVVERLRQDKLPKDITDVCFKYMPGLWKAVEGDEISTVRKLINQWCKVKIQKEGKSLLQLALEKGTEDVIRIISGISKSVSIAHGVLAGDICYVKQLLDNKDKFNVDFKNMGDRSATPLYYAACQNNTEMINLLLSHGARIDLYMTFRESDIPTYFSIMMEYPVVEVTTLKLLLPVKPVSVDKMFYQGRNVLFHCVDCNMHTDIIEEILKQSSAEIVTQRIQNNMTALDYAEEKECNNVVNMINKYVSLWWYSKDYENQKKILVLHGYVDIPQIIQPSFENKSQDISKEDNSLEEYLNQIECFHEAVEMCEVEKVKKLLFSENSLNLQSCLADSRVQGKGQPALHKAVLRKDVETCSVIAETLVYHCKQKIDSVRDQFFRTALHYAHGMTDGKILVDLLIDHGSSDFAVDKDGRSPLAFKDRQEIKEMKDLLQYQLLQDLAEPEPDPWSVRIPMPVVGYLMECAHSQHKHLTAHVAERLAVELNPIGHHYDNQSNNEYDKHVNNHHKMSTNHQQVCCSDTYNLSSSKNETCANGQMLDSREVTAETSCDESDGDADDQSAYTSHSPFCNIL